MNIILHGKVSSEKIDPQTDRKYTTNKCSNSEREEMNRCEKDAQSYWEVGDIDEVSVFHCICSYFFFEKFLYSKEYTNKKVLLL